METNEKLRDFPRLERDGKVAVLYSPGYGAGWSTWHDDEWRPLLAMHRDLCLLVAEDKRNAVTEMAEKLLREYTGQSANLYPGGVKKLEIMWLSGVMSKIEKLWGRTIYVSA